ncbi:FAD-dependent oxidoreductase [Nonomuraea sp. WAC 01424]|uniref:FAD-dependent oxidoreductase n=1 Tax=Nonomuraea sp. WAC 01424 TaxID=2203200 RepID=UPI001C8C2609|nr:FAD-dependent oxidoreductase [Nonomuraea sp. WAC 01424]
MAHVVIIGGGFAGVWSAAGAALARERAAGDTDLRITLIAPNDHLVLRPRLYEPEPDLAKVELRRILGPIGVRHLRASVSTIDTDRRTVVADGEEIGYDRLVLAAGSRLVRPHDLPGAGCCWWTGRGCSRTSSARARVRRSKPHWTSWASNTGSARR